VKLWGGPIGRSNCRLGGKLGNEGIGNTWERKNYRELEGRKRKDKVKIDTPLWGGGGCGGETRAEG